MKDHSRILSIGPTFNIEIADGYVESDGNLDVVANDILSIRSNADTIKLQAKNDVFVTATDGEIITSGGIVSTRTDAGNTITVTGGHAAGSAIHATAGSSGGNAITAVGDNNGGYVIHATAGTNSTSAIYGTGGSGSTIGIQGQGTQSGSGGYFVGGTTGYGTYGRGGVSGAEGGFFLGTGIKSGVYTVGGDTDGPGITAIGTAGGAGAVLTGGATGRGANISATELAPTRAVLRLSPQYSRPSTVVAGDIQISKENGKFCVYDGYSWNRYAPQVYSKGNTATEDQITSTSEAAFATKYTIEANTLTIGSTIRLRAGGNKTGNSSADYTIKARIGGISGTLFFASFDFAANTNAQWVIDAEAVIMTTGPSGTLACASVGTSSLAAASPDIDNSVETSVAIDTTGDLDVVVTGLVAGGAGGDALNLKYFRLDVC